MLLNFVSVFWNVASQTITDSPGNTYTANGSVTGVDTNGASTVVAYNLGGTTNASHTWSFPHAGVFGTSIGAAFSGAAASSVVDGSPVTVDGHGVQTVTTGTFTPTNNGELIIAACGASGNTSGFIGGGTITASAGWSTLQSGGIVAGTALGGALFYQIQTAKTAVTFTCTQTVDTGEMVASITGYNPASCTSCSGGATNSLLFGTIP